MKKSTHRVEVVHINPEKHPNADALVIQRVFGYQVVLRAADWAGVTLGAYIQPDSVVDTDRPEFAWLKGPNFRAAKEGDTRFHRVCAMRLRSVISYGLMVPAPAGSKEGDDVSDLLGVTRYQPTIIAEGAIDGPEGYTAEYDLEAFERYADNTFKPDEEVLAFEKLDGVNARYCYRNQMYAGSKTIWLEKRTDSTWWKNLGANPGLVDLCRQHDLVVYGEIVGYPQGHATKMRYGIKPGETDFYIFDIMHGTSFLPWVTVAELAQQYKLKTVPLVASTKYNFAELMKLADGPSLIPGAKHNREGIVVRAKNERQELVGRTVLKLVSGRSLLG